ncbi:GTP pyrophosphokinase [compost metagenome]
MSLELVLRAAAFAGEAHGTQTRKGSPQPYITHPLRVAHAASLAGLSSEAIAASLLHDVVEDTPVTLDDLSERFPERVVHLVHLLTKWWPDDAPKDLKASEKPKYYGAILEDDDAMALKLLDRADNLQDMVRMLPRMRGWAERYLKKTEREIQPIAEACPNAMARSEYARAIADLHRALGPGASRA